MGYNKEQRPQLNQGSAENLSSLSTAGTINNLGYFELNSTSTDGPIVMTLQNPPAARRNRVVLSCRTIGSTSSSFHVNTSSSGITYNGNDDMITLSTGDAIVLIAQSTSRWIIESGFVSTGLALSTST